MNFTHVFVSLRYVKCCFLAYAQDMEFSHSSLSFSAIFFSIFISQSRKMSLTHAIVFTPRVLHGQ